MEKSEALEVTYLDRVPTASAQGILLPIPRLCPRVTAAGSQPQAAPDGGQALFGSELFVLLLAEFNSACFEIFP